MTRTATELRGERAERVLARVRAIPPGFVRAYSDLDPGAPRFAGAVLSVTHDPDVPWQRVVRADGSIPKGEPQRRLLRAEGVPLRGDRVDMAAARLPHVLGARWAGTGPKSTKTRPSDPASLRNARGQTPLVALPHS